MGELTLPVPTLFRALTWLQNPAADRTAPSLSHREDHSARFESPPKTTGNRLTHRPTCRVVLLWKMLPPPSSTSIFQPFRINAGPFAKRFRGGEWPC